MQVVATICQRNFLARSSSCFRSALSRVPTDLVNPESFTDLMEPRTVDATPTRLCIALTHAPCLGPIPRENQPWLKVHIATSKMGAIADGPNCIHRSHIPIPTSDSNAQISTPETRPCEVCSTSVVIKVIGCDSLKSDSLESNLEYIKETMDPRKAVWNRYNCRLYWAFAS
jgi:hypothetical protein